MPRFLVKFPRPVTVIRVAAPGALRRTQTITELPVHAPSVEAAKIHAIRVVQGDVDGMTVEDWLPPPPPAVEIIDTPPITIDLLGGVLRHAAP